MPVITIGRTYGAGGETIAAMVAQRLGADLVDRKIFDEVARRLDMTEDEVEKLEEAPGSLLNRFLRALGSASVEFAAPPEGSVWTPPYSDPTMDTSKAVLQITQEMIREAHRSGSAVIVGRGAAYVLRGEPGVLHVFVTGPNRARVSRVRELYGLAEEEARRRVKQTDANRGAYVKQVYGHDWLDPQHYHLMLNTAWLGYERSARLIGDAAGATL
jgi:cytidylate kinase